MEVWRAQLARFVCFVVMLRCSLAADVRSYLREKATHEDAYAAASAPGSGLAANDVKRARDFVDEADATLADVRQRLQESWQMLTHYLAELHAGGLHSELMADACVAEARAMLREVEPLVNVPQSAEAPVARPLKVCVLGDSQLNEGEQAPAKPARSRTQRKAWIRLTWPRR